MIAAIGIDRYQHWPYLSNAVSSARGVADMFGRLGFEKRVLLDEAATGIAIQLFMDDLERRLGPDDSLVLFYAGHSSTHHKLVGDTQIKIGCLIPADASRTDASTWIDLDSWLDRVSMLPARHILVILDAHSGIWSDPWRDWRYLDERRDQPLSVRSTRRSRQILTSGRDDEVAFDGGPLFEHSLFTGCLIAGLAYLLRRADSRVTSASELGRFVQHRVQSYPESRQAPGFGRFRFDNWGEMVLAPLDQPPPMRAAPSSADLLPRGARGMGSRSGVETPLASRPIERPRAENRRRTIDLQLRETNRQASVHGVTDASVVSGSTSRPVSRARETSRPPGIRGAQRKTSISGSRRPDLL